MFKPSALQNEIISWWRKAPKLGQQHAYVVGPYGSGKTESAVRGLAQHVVLRMPHGSLGAVMTKSKSQLKETIFFRFEEECKRFGATVRTSGDIWLVRTWDGNEIKIMAIPFEQRNAVARAENIRSLTLGCLLVDEATNMSDEVRVQTLARMRDPRADNLCMWTMNPDSPYHPFKLEMIDNKGFRGKEFNVPMSANPTLTPAYIESLKAAYPEKHRRERFIEGKWSAPEGLIWQIEEGVHIKEWPGRQYEYAVIGFDHAYETISYGCLIGVSEYTEPIGAHVVAEWRYDAERDGPPIVEKEQAARVFEHLHRGWHVTNFVCDRTATAMILSYQQLTGIGQAQSEDWGPNTERVSMLLHNGYLTIDPSCVWLIRDIYNFKYADKYTQRKTGSVRPKNGPQGGNHAVDGFMYGSEALPWYFAGRLGQTFSVSSGNLG